MGEHILDSIHRMVVSVDGFINMIPLRSTIPIIICNFVGDKVQIIDKIQKWSRSFPREDVLMGWLRCDVSRNLRNSRNDVIRSRSALHSIRGEQVCNRSAGIDVLLNDLLLKDGRISVDKFMYVDKMSVFSPNLSNRGWLFGVVKIPLMISVHDNNSSPVIHKSK